ncbi:Dimethylaniline monooxygenase [N-oxide-forming], partial [Lachnellula willkommii]
IIGGGPGGLVTLKYLLQAHKFLSTKPIEARLFEGGSEIGGTFRQRSYEDAEQVSSKYLTTFSDLRPSKEAPDFLPVEDYLVYLEEYCTLFGLWGHIELSTTVTRLQRHGVSKHIVSLAKAGGMTEDWECGAVAICTGLHVTPNVPDIAGIENIPLVLHSSQFKARNQFGKNTNVVVLGSGETGMDPAPVAHLAVTSPTRTVALLPNPLMFGRFRSTGPEIPTDVVTASLFESMYVHPIMRRSLIPWRYYDAFVQCLFLTISGTKHGIDQWVGGLSDEKLRTSESKDLESRN